MKARALMRWFASVGLCGVAACTKASTPIPAQVGKSLELRRPASPAPSKFGVAFAGPTGEVAVESEIQLVFSRPIRPLAAATDPPTPSILLRPAIPGKWRWLGTHALVFSPAQQRLPFASEIEVEVPAAIRADDGTPLGAPYKFRFQTQAPKLARVESADDANHLKADSQFSLLFDQPVELEALRAKLRLEVTRGGKTDRYPFELAPLPKKLPNQGFRLTPKQPLPRAAAVRVLVEPGLRGFEGPRATAAAQSKDFATIQPLRIEQITCDRATPKSQCDSRSGLEIEFNNAVSVRALRNAITIDGKRAKLAQWHTDDSPTSYVHLPGPFRAGTTAAIRIATTLEDTFGQRLGRQHNETITFDDFFPKMEIGLQGDVFETSQPAPIPIGLVNVASYERLFLPLSIEGLASLLAADTSDSLFVRGLSVKGAGLSSQSPKYRENQLGIESFDPSPSYGPLLGAGLIGVRYQGIAREGKPVTLTDARLVQRTNLGISGEIGHHASVIWVTTLDAGRPVANAEVGLLDKEGRMRGRTTTDRHGIARFAADAISTLSMEEPTKHPLAIVATHGYDLAFRRLSDLIPEWRIPVSVDRSGRQGSRLMLFAERELYRPGERVDVKAVLRDEHARGLRLPRAGILRLELVSPDSQAVATTTQKLSEFGTAAAHFAIPLSAKTGQWSVRVRDNQETLGSTPITIGEYRPIELDVSVTPAKSEMVRGGKLTAEISAKTLFGMATAGAKVRLEARRERTTFVPPGRDDYVVTADVFDELRRDDNYGRAELLLANRQLDDQGRTQAEVSAELPAARGPEWITFEAEVTDATENPVAASARTLVHPADHYVALRRLKDAWIGVPSKLGVDVAAFGPDGAWAKGRSIKVELIRRSWSIARREVGGVVQTTNEPSDEVVGNCLVKTELSDQHCNFELLRSGSYYVVARSQDGSNRPTTAALALFAVGQDSAEISDSDEHRIELVPDKTTYQIGDVAKVLVKSPITDVDALVVVGRSDAHSVELKHLTGQSPVIEVPIREDMRPNMFVTAHLVTPRRRAPPARLEQPDLGAPSYRVGWAELRIDSSDRRLTVELSPSTRVTKPGAGVDVSVTVRDANARPVRSEVTLWAVDEAVLRLGTYEVPDPNPIFLGSRPLQLLPVESRESLGRRTLASMRDELGLTKGTPGSGGGESGAMGPLRQDFRTTAVFRPDLVTDKDGQVKAHFTLPDSLTSYRVFAMAVSGTEQFGFASDRIITKKPLMIRPVMPRFLREGDRADLGVVLSAMDTPDGDATVTMAATGVVSKSNQQTVKLARGKSSELLFPIEASGEGNWSIRLEAKCGSVGDSVKLERPLQPVLAEEVVAGAGETRTRVLEKIGNLSEARPDRGYLELQLSSSLFGGAVGGFNQLIEYPYGCSEQISSRLMALVPLADLARSAGVTLPKEREHLIEVAVAELLRRQNEDGGFVMWSDAATSEPWVSAHVLAALNEVKGAQRKTVASAIDRGTEYLRHVAATSLGPNSAPSVAAVEAYVADVLQKLGRPDPGLLSRLFAIRERMPVFAQAMVLEAYSLSGHDAQATATLVGELERFVHNDGAKATVVTNQGDDYARLFDSDTRTAAIITTGLAAARPDHPLLVPLARGLLDARRNGRWATTQESAFALLALDQVRRAKNMQVEGIRARALLGDTQLFAGNVGGKAPISATQRIRMATLGTGEQPLLIEADGGTLLYETRLHYWPKQPRLTPIDAGFALERSYLPVAPNGKLGGGEAVSAESATIRAEKGQIFVVELAVVVPRPREFVVVDSPIPAGFEAIDVTHRTSSGWMQKLDRIDSIGPDGDQNLVFHRDLRDDRAVFLVDHFPVGLYRLRYLVRAVTRGTFALPPSRVEAMYNPEHFGTTRAETVEVK